MFSRSTHPHRWDLGPADLPAPPASRPNTPADVYSATVTPHVLPPNDPSRKGSPTFPNLYMAPSIPLRGYASIIATLCTLPTISLIAQFARGTAPITHPAASKTGVQVLKLGIIPKSFRCANEHFSMSLEWVDEHWNVVVPGGVHTKALVHRNGMEKVFVQGSGETWVRLIGRMEYDVYPSRVVSAGHEPSNVAPAIAAPARNEPRGY